MRTPHSSILRLRLRFGSIDFPKKKNEEEKKKKMKIYWNGRKRTEWNFVHVRKQWINFYGRNADMVYWFSHLYRLAICYRFEKLKEFYSALSFDAIILFVLLGGFFVEIRVEIIYINSFVFFLLFIHISFIHSFMQQIIHAHTCIAHQIETERNVYEWCKKAPAISTCNEMGENHSGYAPLSRKHFISL